jgi:hypothetical protein
LDGNSAVVLAEIQGILSEEDKLLNPFLNNDLTSFLAIFLLFNVWHRIVANQFQYLRSSGLEHWLHNLLAS